MFHSEIVAYIVHPLIRLAYWSEILRSKEWNARVTTDSSRVHLHLHCVFSITLYTVHLMHVFVVVCWLNTDRSSHKMHSTCQWITWGYRPCPSTQALTLTFLNLARSSFLCIRWTFSSSIREILEFRTSAEHSKSCICCCSWSRSADKAATDCWAFASACLHQRDFKIYICSSKVGFDAVEAHSCIDTSSEIHWWAIHNY